MQLSKIEVQNYRLLVDTKINVDPKTTVIVGKNNTGKTSFFQCISDALSCKPFSYDDYPLEKREDLLHKLTDFMEGNISFEDLSKQIAVISVDFFIDYSKESPTDNLSTLSPFIIDVDVDTEIARIRVEYDLTANAKNILSQFYQEISSNGAGITQDDIRDMIRNKFSNLFEPVIYAVNPTNPEERQQKTRKELKDLFHIWDIPAERNLGESDKPQNTLTSLISTFFDMQEEGIEPELLENLRSLREIVNSSNKNIQKQCDELLSALVDKIVGFGYPQSEELKLGVQSKLSIDDQLKNQTRLSYIPDTSKESLPEAYNGLGYRNLITIAFLLASYAREWKKYPSPCITLLFIEEPESHMHPQMQHSFAAYLEKYLSNISSVNVQTFITSHSAHIVNTIKFSKIRYAKRTLNRITYRDLNEFYQQDKAHAEFIQKYLTLTKCDLFFADKAIFVEGTSERLLIPHMIDKCTDFQLQHQYYTLIEVGGAFAYKFIPFIEFLKIPSLIITDLDPVAKNDKSSYQAVLVSQGESTSNATIKWWFKEVKTLDQEDRSLIPLRAIMALSPDEKTLNKYPIHIEFQTTENGFCGRSLEESIRNVNREFYQLPKDIEEKDLTFKEKSKTDFALKLISENENYNIPEYIRSGLKWLNDQKVLK